MNYVINKHKTYIWTIYICCFSKCLYYKALVWNQIWLDCLIQIYIFKFKKQICYLPDWARTTHSKYNIKSKIKVIQSVNYLLSKWAPFQSAPTIEVMSYSFCVYELSHWSQNTNGVYKLQPTHVTVTTQDKQHFYLRGIGWIIFCFLEFVSIWIL